MPIVAYERARKSEAERLGIRASELDKAVAAQRPRGEIEPGQGRPRDFPPPEPWPDPPDGADLLDSIEALVRRYVICSEHAAVAMALWVALTWFEEVAQARQSSILNLRRIVAENQRLWPWLGGSPRGSFSRRIPPRPPYSGRSKSSGRRLSSMRQTASLARTRNCAASSTPALPERRRTRSV